MSYLKLDDYTVPGHGLKVSCNFDFKAQDISGNSSSTALAGQGTKAKSFGVRVFIKYNEAEALRKLIEVAQARDNAFTAKEYTITNDTANAMGVRKVAFVGRFSVDEQDSQNRWQVSFTLNEKLSIDEMVEARIKDPIGTFQGAMEYGAPVLDGFKSAIDAFTGDKKEEAQNAAGAAGQAAGSVGGDGSLEKTQKSIHKQIGPKDHGTF